MRLIDAKAIEKEAKESFKEKPFLMDLLLRWIRKQPTIEAEPVRQGRWVYEKTYQGMKYVCSECGEIPECFEPNYCPNCGAKMDLEDEENG